MDPNVFRKGDAPSCLVVDRSWNDIINKPDFFDELEKRIVAMMTAAENADPIIRATTFRQFKDSINKILLEPLQKDIEVTESSKQQRPGTILADAFWDEILIPDDTWIQFRDALARAYAMKLEIGEHQPLTAKDTLQDTKDNFNETIVNPLLGVNEDE